MARGGGSPEAHWKRGLEAVSSPLEAGVEERRSGNSPRGSTRVGEDRTGASTELGFLGVDGNAESSMRRFSSRVSGWKGTGDMRSFI